MTTYLTLQTEETWTTNCPHLKGIERLVHLKGNLDDYLRKIKAVQSHANVGLEKNT